MPDNKHEKKDVISQTVRLPKEMVDKIELFQARNYLPTRHSAILNLINLGLRSSEDR